MSDSPRARPAATAGRAPTPLRSLVAEFSVRRAAILAAAAAFGLAACSGSSSPHVARLPTSTSLGTGNSNRAASSATTLPTGNATALVDEWASCMRTHGDPDQVEPTIDPDNVIQVIVPASAPGVLKGSGAQTCASDLTAAQTALRGGQTLQKPAPATLVKLSRCMRANGIPDFPDPSPERGYSIHSLAAGGELNPNDPTYQNAAKLCTQKYGVSDPMAGGTPLPGSIVDSGGPGSNGGIGING
jgi:hypothetical protein